jgi:hypothetical protein
MKNSLHFCGFGLILLWDHGTLATRYALDSGNPTADASPGYFPDAWPIFLMLRQWQIGDAQLDRWDANSWDSRSM